MEKYVVIVAGGKGERMLSKLPKQFHEVKGLPLLMHTMNAFYAHDAAIHQIIVLPGPHISLWKDLCSQYSFGVEHSLAEGGPARYHSVKSGLRQISSPDVLIAVHDAVRPLVSPQVIAKVYRDAAIYGNAVPVIPVNETVREKNGPASRPVDRSKLFLVQTPQCFKGELLKKAYLHNYREEFTDDASVVEYDGLQIHLVEGNSENIKITTPADLLMAAALLPSKDQD